MMLRIPSLQPSPACGRGGNREEHSWNPDHAPRIRAQQKAQQENAAMAELEQRSAPLLWAVYVCVVALALSFTSSLLRGHFEEYADLAANNEALVQCLNGHLINIDSVLVSCEAHRSTLVAQVGGATRCGGADGCGNAPRRLLPQTADYVSNESEVMP